ACQALRSTFRRSRISTSRASCGVGGGGGTGAGWAASQRRTAFMPFTSQNTTQATIMNLIEVLMKAPYLIATSSLALVSGLSGLSTHCSLPKSTPDSSRPIGGITTSSTSDLTMSLNDAPMITPTARSMTLPRAMNSRNSVSMLTACFTGGGGGGNAMNG